MKSKVLLHRLRVFTTQFSDAIDVFLYIISGDSEVKTLFLCTQAVQKILAEIGRVWFYHANQFVIIPSKSPILNIFQKFISNLYFLANLVKCRKITCPSVARTCKYSLKTSPDGRIAQVHYQCLASNGNLKKKRVLLNFTCLFARITHSICLLSFRHGSNGCEENWGCHQC